MTVDNLWLDLENTEEYKATPPSSCNESFTQEQLDDIHKWIMNELKAEMWKDEL